MEVGPVLTAYKFGPGRQGLVSRGTIHYFCRQVLLSRHFDYTDNIKTWHSICITIL